MKIVDEGVDVRQKGVTFTFADCNNQILHKALEKIDNKADVFSGADLSRFMKIKNTYDSKSKFVKKAFQKLLTKHAIHETVKDAAGKPVLRKDGRPEVTPKMFRTPRGTMDFEFHNDQDFSKDYKELMSETFTVEAYRLLTEDLTKVGLTPKEIRACAKILSDIDPEIVPEPEMDDEDDDKDYPEHIEDDEEEALDTPEDGPETESESEAENSESEPLKGATSNHAPRPQSSHPDGQPSF